jgi:hypothetical protein
MPQPAEKAVDLSNQLYTLPIDEVRERRRIVSELRDLARGVPSDPNVRLPFAIGLFQLGSREEAASHLEAAYNLRANLKPGNHTNLVRALLVGGQLDRARTALREVDEFGVFSSGDDNAEHTAMTAVALGDAEFAKSIAEHAQNFCDAHVFAEAIEAHGIADALPLYVNILMENVEDVLCDISVRIVGDDPDPKQLVFEPRVNLPYKERRKIERVVRKALRDRLDRDTYERLDSAIVVNVLELPDGGLKLAA